MSDRLGHGDLPVDNLPSVQALLKRFPRRFLVVPTEGCGECPGIDFENECAAATYGARFDAQADRSDERFGCFVMRFADPNDALDKNDLGLAEFGVNSEVRDQTFLDHFL